MALPIRDGNQSLTTLSTLIISNSHVPAHTVVSFGTQGITDIATAVSGVELGPNTLNALENITVTLGQVTITGGLTDAQLRASAVTIGGSVTATISGTSSVTFGTAVITGSTSILNFPATQPVSIASVTIGNSVTIASLPAISGTVTANVFGQYYSGGGNEIYPIAVGKDGESFNIGNGRVAVEVVDKDGTSTFENVIGFWPETMPSKVLAVGGYNSIDNKLRPIPIYANFDAISGGQVVGIKGEISGTVTASFAISSNIITSGSFTSLTSATLVPANASRKMATVYNLGAGQLFVNAGATATTIGGGFMVALSSGDFYECNYTTTTLSAIFATAGTASWVSY